MYTFLPVLYLCFSYWYIRCQGGSDVSIYYDLIHIYCKERTCRQLYLMYSAICAFSAWKKCRKWAHNTTHTLTFWPKENRCSMSGRYFYVTFVRWKHFLIYKDCMSLEWQVNSTIVINPLKDCLHLPIMQSCLKTKKGSKEHIWTPIFYALELNHNRIC